MTVLIFLIFIINTLGDVGPQRGIENMTCDHCCTVKLQNDYRFTFSKNHEINKNFDSSGFTSTKVIKIRETKTE